jgi:hypothetical protein
MSTKVRYLGDPLFSITEIKTEQHKRFEEIERKIKSPLDVFKLSQSEETFMRNFVRNPPPMTRKRSVQYDDTGNVIRTFPTNSGGMNVPLLNILGKFNFHPTGALNKDGYPEYLCASVPEEYVSVLEHQTIEGIQLFAKVIEEPSVTVIKEREVVVQERVEPPKRRRNRRSKSQDAATEG